MNEKEEKKMEKKKKKMKKKMKEKTKRNSVLFLASCTAGDEPTPLLISFLRPSLLFLQQGAP